MKNKLKMEIKLLNFLYKPEYWYEVAYNKNGYHRRNMMIKGKDIPDFIFGHESDEKFILSYPSIKKTLRKNIIYDKIWFDFDVDDPSQLIECKHEVYWFATQLQKDYHVIPYIQYSGSKGYHLYAFFLEPIETEKKIIQEMLRTLRKKYQLKYVCESCITGPIREQRLPYTQHKNGQWCIPLQTQIDSSTKLNDLHELCKRKVNKKEELHNIKWKKMQETYKNKDTTIFEVDTRLIWEDLHGSLIVKREANYIRSDCPWHNSKSGNPVMVGDRVATCHHCGSFNSYQVVLKYMNGDVRKTMEYLKKYKN